MAAVKNKPKAPKAKGAKPAKTPKTPVFGGTSEAPALGANGRRLWAHLTQELPKSAVATLRRQVIASTPEGDRFIRWETIVAEAQKMGFENVTPGLVRRLQLEDKGGKVGRKAISF